MDGIGAHSNSRLACSSADCSLSSRNIHPRCPDCVHSAAQMHATNAVLSTAVEGGQRHLAHTETARRGVMCARTDHASLVPEQPQPSSSLAFSTATILPRVAGCHMCRVRLLRLRGKGWMPTPSVSAESATSATATTNSAGATTTTTTTLHAGRSDRPLVHGHSLLRIRCALVLPKDWQAG